MINTAQAVLASRIMCEHSEFISVVSVETILSPEPDESLIVLYDLIRLGFGRVLEQSTAGRIEYRRHRLLEFARNAGRHDAFLRKHSLKRSQWKTTETRQSGVMQTQR